MLPLGSGRDQSGPDVWDGRKFIDHFSGEKLVEITKECTKCGAPLILEQKFCGECGVKTDPDS